MLKGEDIVILLKLASPDAAWTVRALEEATGIPKSGVQRALKRLATAGLIDERRQRVNLSQAEEFLVHGAKYVFPASLAGPARGVPTAWGAAPLREHLAATDEPEPVWPDPHGEVRGLTLTPLHPKAPEAGRRDSRLGEALALVDAIRAGDARTRKLAAGLLRERLVGPAP